MQQRSRTFLAAIIITLLVVGPALVTLPGGNAVRAASDAVGPTDPAEVGAFFDGLIGQQLVDKHIAGATVAVVKDNALLFAKGYGYADVQKQTPVDADRTLFYIGSAGKLFTWTAVMQLVEQGKLDLHTDVNTYLDFRIPATFATPITVADLLTHTAGFEEQLAAVLTTQNGVLPLRDSLLHTMPARVSPPGRYIAYSNYGTVLAGYIVQRVSGEPYEQYITNHLLDPLHMTHSAAVQPLPPALMADLSQGYKYTNGRYEARDFEWVAAVPAGPVHATATDMAKFMLAHLNDGQYGDGHILSAATAQEMHRQQFTMDPRLPGVADGFFLSPQNGESILWHDGASARFVTILGLLPARHVGVFVSYNTPAVEPDETLTAFVNHYYPASTPPPQAIPDAHLGRFAGTFVPLRAAVTGPQQFITDLGAITVSVGDDHTLRAFDHRYVETEPGLFRQRDGTGPFSALTFQTDGHGNTAHLFLGPLAYARVPWYRTLTAHLAPLGVGLLLSLTALVVWPLDALLRRVRHRPPMGREARFAQWVAGILGLLSLLLLGGFLLLMVGYGDTYIYPSAAVVWVTRLLLLLVPLAVGVVTLTILAWKGQYWNLTWRLHYTAVAVGTVALVVVLNSWHLLGMGG